MSSVNRSKDRRPFILPTLYLTLLLTAALCAAGLSGIGTRRVAASDVAGETSGVAPTHRRAAAASWSPNQANPTPTPTPTPTPAPAPAQTPGGGQANPAAAGAQAPATGAATPPPTICRDVNLGPAQRSAKELAAEFNGTSGLSAKALTERVLLLCGVPRTVDAFKSIAERVTGGAPARNVNETHNVRLFFLRKAPEIADAINKSGRLSAPVKAFGDDLLFFPSESVADDEAIHQFRRWISVIDMPRPEIALMTWSVQISSGSPDTINRESVRIRSTVSGFNDRLQSALEQGWWFLEESRRKYGEKFYAENLSSYLSHRYLWARPGTAINANAPKPPCGADKYCLGYTRIFKPIQPSLTNMLLALIAAQPGGYDEARMAKLRDSFVDCLENRKACEAHYAELKSLAVPSAEGQERQMPRPTRPQGYYEVKDDYGAAPAKSKARDRVRQAKARTAAGVETTTCEQSDLDQLTEAEAARQRRREEDRRAGTSGGDGAADGAEERPGPAFYCFREQLHRRLGSGHLGQTRRALADFLYQYKSAEYYPRDFVAWNQAASAQALDGELEPLIVAFNRDLNVYLRHIQDEVQFGHRREKKATFESDGIVTARVISGNTAKIETTTQSFFKQPPTLNVRDVVTALTSNPVPTLAPVASGTGAELIAAAIRAEQRLVARVGRHLNIEVTSNTLKGASACEMNVSLDSVEADKPSMLNTVGAGTSADDNLSRVAKHTTNTKVRVDSTKLFEVSSFAAALVRGRSIPLIPPGVDLPYIGSIARLRLPPGTVYHRSFAIVSASIVPTAADLANVIEFSEDLEELPSASGDVQLLAHSVATPTPPPTPQPQPAAQAGRGRRGKRRAAPAPPAPALATAPVFYWIVAHYRDGDSVSGPFRVGNAPPLFNDKNSVTLLWQAPERALSFDVIRTTDPTPVFEDAKGKRLLVENTTRHAYVDDDGGLRDYAGRPALRTAFARITRPAGNLRAFHKAMLDCIEDEARGDTSTRCSDAFLSKQATEGRGQ